jgi:NAD(P)-dependent dehydrogenase (short-subunit alcohol dehydrogenase family)
MTSTHSQSACPPSYPAGCKTSQPLESSPDPRAYARTCDPPTATTMPYHVRSRPPLAHWILVRVFGWLRRYKMDKWWATVKLNLFGTFAVCSKVAAIASQQDPVNEDGERGVLVNVASAAAIDGQDGQSAYSAAKAGIVGMTLPMARDLSRVGIRCCTILPVRRSRLRSTMI